MSRSRTNTENDQWDVPKELQSESRPPQDGAQRQDLLSIDFAAKLLGMSYHVEGTSRQSAA
eukprot:3166047-Amphidinium_carterae.1